jgi:CO dehydrogenase/acetyl-CoA synthase epsilon subunit
MATGTLPYHFVNVLTGTKSARLIEDPAEYAHLIKRAKRPLLVVGSWSLTTSLGGKLLLEYATDIARTLDIPICATAHTQRQPRPGHVPWLQD